MRLVTQAGHHLGVPIVAEGIETDEQLAALRSIGCDALQGYRIARPLSPERLEQWRRERRGEGAGPAGRAGSGAALA